MNLIDLFSELATRSTSIRIYSSRAESDVRTHFEGTYVDVDRRPLPGGARFPFVVVRDRDGFVVSVPLERVRDLFEPRIGQPWDPDVPRDLIDLLEGVVFSSLDRRQLLAVSRDLEGRAWRVGHGALHVGFQRRSAMVDQIPVYERLGAETALDVHVYCTTDREPPDLANATVHSGPAEELGRFWFLVFDGAGDHLETYALVAEETEPGHYRGFWTGDPDFVDDVLSYLRETYG